MNIEAFLLCDAATDQNGKLNILGAFDGVQASQVPCTHSACAVAARIRFEKIEDGGHQLRLSVIDDDGKAVIPRLDAVLSVRIPDDAESAVVNSIVNIQQITLPAYGTYRVDLAVDGQLQASLPFVVKAPSV